MTTQVSTCGAKGKNPWIAPAISAAIVFLAFLLHLMGHLVYQKHLSSWGLDIGLFPPSLDELAAKGWFALVHLSLGSLTAIGLPYLGWALALIAGAGGVSFVAWVGRRWVASPVYERNLANPEGAGFSGMLLRMVLPIIAGLMLLPSSALVLSGFLLLPVALATAAGEQIHQQEKEVFAKGCQMDLRYLCIDVKRDGKLLTRGFIIVSSATHVAVFELMTQSPRVIERAGTELFVVSSL